MISVCMATYNGEKYIQDQINSILYQLGEDDELIISDDGSIDRTLEIIREIDDSRIKLVINSGKHGYTGNFYNSLKKANGDIIFLSDQDDVWMNNKVKTTIKELEKSDFTVSDAVEVDANLNVICESRFKKYRVKKGYLSNLIRCRYLGCCLAFRRNVLDVLFPVPSYGNDFPHDLWITLVAEKYFRTSIIDEPLIYYRRHGENASDGGDHGSRSLWVKIKSRITYVSAISRVKERVRNC